MSKIENQKKSIRIQEMDNNEHECEGIECGDTDTNQRYNRVCDKDESEGTEAKEEPTEAIEEKVAEESIEAIEEQAVDEPIEEIEQQTFEDIQIVIDNFPYH
jgi:hypothetical protein